MITILSGVPGSGKTAKIVELIMSDLKAGRKVFTIGIPGLMLNVQQGGNPHHWQDGTWLQIDRYDPKLTRRKGIQGEWFPRNCEESCPYLSTCPRNFEPPPDAGAVIYIDEAHVAFPQRPSGKEPPPHVQALTVHRHQGLDFVFITQRPQFLDPFVRGLASKHVHIELSAISINGTRNEYEWPEYQENISRLNKLLAAKSKYKPAPHVFPLYKSATVHTKLDQRMPTVLKMFLGLCIVSLIFFGWAFNRANQRYTDYQKPILPVKASAPQDLMSASAVQPIQPVQHFVDEVPSRVPFRASIPRADSCMAMGDDCRCYESGKRLDIDPVQCFEMLEGGFITPRTERSDYLVATR